MPFFLLLLFYLNNIYDIIRFQGEGVCNMKEKIAKNIKWVILGILLVLFALISVFMVKDKINVYDNYIYNIISKTISPAMTTIVKVITNFANPIIIVVFGLIFSYIVGIKKKDRKTAILFCLNLVIVSLLNYLLKNIFTRTRPELINIIAESGYSFPSGHSSIAMAMYGYLIYLVNTRCSNRKVKLVTTILLSILILLIGVSRVYLGVHYASDVTAAFLLFLGYLIVFTYITENIKSKS